jgi:type VI secretion system lysozyme-like protein
MAATDTLLQPRYMSPGDYIQSIVSNLNCILNTKKGYGYLHPDYGLSDYTYHGSDRTPILLMEEVARNIELFEPRIRVIEIQAVKDASTPRCSLRIDCEIIAGSRALKLSIAPQLSRYVVSPA